jgi:SPX domain protein involved in polyphosphate accumulation
MKTQTAVEWLEEQFEESYSYINEIFKETIEQAKELEKQQKEETWVEGIDYSIMVLKDKTSKTSKEAFDEYYELTYGGNK